MPTELFANAANTILAGNGGSISAAATTVQVANASGFPAAATGVSQFRAAFVDVGVNPPAVLEYVTVTNVSGNTLTVTRASEDATRYPAGSRPDGTGFYQLVTAGALAEVFNRATPGQALAFSLVLGG